jgi:hypothetical protein
LARTTAETSAKSAASFGHKWQRAIEPIVVVIVEKLVSHLAAATDPYLRTDLVERITQAAERFAPSNAWYIETMLRAFELGGDLIKPDVAQNLLRLLAEGSGESDDADAALRRDAVEENTGEKLSFTEKLEANADNVPDLQPADCDDHTRALADVCLALLNTNEFAYVY